MAHLTRLARVGSFNWASPGDKQTDIALGIVDGGKRIHYVSTLIPGEHGEPHWDETRPIESAFRWLNEIEDSIPRWTTRRGETLAQIAEMRAYLDDERGVRLAIDMLTATRKPIAEKLEKIDHELAGWQRTLAFIAAEATEQAPEVQP